MTCGSEMENAMIEAIEFTNFKALRKTTLPLAPFTLLLGPNGSGKTSVLQALQAIAGVAATSTDINGRVPGSPDMRSSLLSVTAENRDATIELKLRLRVKTQIVVATIQWRPDGQLTRQIQSGNGIPVEATDGNLVL